MADGSQTFWFIKIKKILNLDIYVKNTPRISFLGYLIIMKSVALYPFKKSTSKKSL